MMAAEQVEKTNGTDRRNRSIEYLLKKYETKNWKEGEVINQRFKEEWRENKRFRFARKACETLHVKGELKDQVLWIIQNGPSTKKLCGRCTCETATLAIIFYVKFLNTKKRPLEDYQVARKYGLTEEKYASIVTKLGGFFQKKMALSRRVKAYDNAE